MLGIDSPGKWSTYRLHHGSIFGLVGLNYQFELEVIGGEEEIEIPFNKKRKLPQPSPVPSSPSFAEIPSKAQQSATTPSPREGGESDDTQHKKRRVSHSEENTGEESEVVDLIRSTPENGEEESEGTKTKLGTKKKKKRILIEDNDDEQESERFYADFEAALGKSVAAEGKGKGKAKANASENRNEKEKGKENEKEKEKGKEKMTEKEKKEMEALKRFEMEEDSMYDEDEALARRLQQEEDQSEGSSPVMSEREKADAALARKLFEEETKSTRARKDAEKKDQEIARKLQEQENNKKKGTFLSLSLIIPRIFYFSNKCNLPSCT